MKKFWKVFFVMVMVVALAACGVAPVSEKEAAEKKSEQESEVFSEEGVIEEKKESEEPREVAVGGLDELEDIIYADVEGTITALQEECDELLTRVDTYENYVENLEDVEAFYEKIYTETQNLCIRLREYSVDCTNIILADETIEDKYEELDMIYDCIYDDAKDEIYDEIYNSIRDDLYDGLYNGVVKDGYDVAEYSEWSDVSSEEYERWSDLASDVYEEYSDLSSDVYDFWSDVKEEMWDEDIEKAQKKIDDFVEDIEKLKGKSEVVADTNVRKKEDVADKAEDSDTVKETDSKLVDGMRPEFKEAMDSYEAFYEDYYDMMKKYNSNPTDLSILAEYNELMEKAIEVDEKFAEWNEGEMNDAELKYYLEVTGRISQMAYEILQ